MCGNNYCCSTATSQTENQKPDSSVQYVKEEVAENTACQSQGMEAACCGNAIVLPVGGQVLVEEVYNDTLEDELGRLFLGEWWDETTTDKRPHFLKRLWLRLKGSTS
jgi:hypothetical protein